MGAVGFHLEVRAQLAEQVDYIGMLNLFAYQSVRHADYGTSQAAKRCLFKFSSRPDDFDLFAVDEGNAFAKAQEKQNPEAEPKKTSRRSPPMITRRRKMRSQMKIHTWTILMRTRKPLSDEL